MTKKAICRTDVVNKFMEAATIVDGKLKVVNESAMAEADELLSQLVAEAARNYWAKMESSEDSLADMDDEINYDETNGDSSHTDGSDFDFGGVFEDGEDDYIAPVDGDDDYDDLRMGHDEDGIGADIGSDMDTDMDMDDTDGDALGTDMDDASLGDTNMDQDDLGSDTDFDFDVFSDDDFAPNDDGEQF